MQQFVRDHRSLILKHARAHVRLNSEKIPAEDVAREMELILLQLREHRGVEPTSIEAPDAYLRALALHAANRAKRRRTLIDQIAAGDDLQAVSDDLGALDGDLPEPPAPVQEDAKNARKLLDAIKKALAPADALIFALLIEDDSPMEEVARVLSQTVGEIASARERILHAVETLRVLEGDPMVDSRQERRS